MGKVAILTAILFFAITVLIPVTKAIIAMKKILLRTF